MLCIGESSLCSDQEFLLIEGMKAQRREEVTGDQLSEEVISVSDQCGLQFTGNCISGNRSQITN